MKARISIDNQNKVFIISPDDFELKRLRGISVYVKTLNGGKIEGRTVIIPASNVDTLELYHKTVELFDKKFGCEIYTDSESNSVLSVAESEEKKFKEFSHKALMIRNNNVEKSELDSFLNVVKKREFKRTLKPFQLLSAYHLAFSQNACNFSVPGAGKTTTVLAAYAYLKESDDKRKRVNKLLVVGPISSFLAWKNEYYFCFGKHPDTLEITGATTDKAVENALLRSTVDKDIVLVSYGSVNRRLDILKTFLRNNQAMVVLDEAHRIKNTNDGIQSTVTLMLSPYAKSRVVLTGTPVPNGYEDLYNLYRFIWPAHNVIGYSVIQLSNMSRRENDHRVGDLVDRISPFFIRIKKSDLELPPATFLPPISVAMSPLQERIYQTLAHAAIGRLEQRSTGRIARLSISIRLRQAASNPSLLKRSIDDYYEYADESYSIRHELDSNVVIDEEIIRLVEEFERQEIPQKFIKAKDIVNDIVDKGEKVVIWCEFVGTCEKLSEFFKSVGIDNRILYGKTNYLEREEIIKEFTDVEGQCGYSVIIANPHAVGESISLHKTCHNAIYLEQSFNAGIYMQSKDRIHRVGLSENDHTDYYYLHAQGTIDETVHDRVMMKEERMLRIVESQEIPLISENRDFLEDSEDDIKAIIRDYYDFRNKYI